MTTPPLSSDPDSLSTPDLIKGLRFIAGDGYENAINGLGRSERDAAKATRVSPHVPLTPPEIEDLYRSDYIARKAVDQPAEDATRRGVVVVVQRWATGEGEEDEAGAAISDALEDIGADAALAECLRLNRKDGGAAALIAADDGVESIADYKRPLEPSKIKAISKLLPLERRSIRPHGPTVVAPASRHFGLPISWMVRLQDTIIPGSTTLQEVEVHASRLLIWRGNPVSKLSQGYTSGQPDMWGGDSALELIHEPLRRYRTQLAYAEAAFRRFSVIVVKMGGLAELLMEGDVEARAAGEGDVIRRLRLMSMAISTLNAVPIDKDTEDMSELAATLAGVADVLRLSQDDVAGAANMPLTKLFGHSPAGFSADDEAGRKNYESVVGDEQSKRLRPAYNELVRLLSLMPEGPTLGRLPKRWQVLFRPQETPSEDQVVDRLTKLATTLRDLCDAQIISPVEARNTLRSDPHTILVLEPGDGPAGLDPLEEDPAPAPGEPPTAPPAGPQPSDTSGGAMVV